MNTLTLDKSYPEIAAAVKGCKVGVPKKFTMMVNPTEDTEMTFVADVSEIEYTAEPESGEEAEMPMEGHGKMPKAVIMIGMPMKKGMQMGKAG